MSAEIPLVDLRAQHASIERELAEALTRAAARTDFVLGDEVRAFEKAFASLSGVEHCVGVANGTDALELILRARDIGPGDEVIVSANTFVATALAVVRAGATPRFVDVQDESLLIDLEQVAAAIGPPTRAVIAVHLYGQMAAVEDLAKLCDDAGIDLLEDAAQAHGAQRDGRGPATLGRAAGVSFYPSKNLGALGDAGAVLTNDDELARRVRALGNYGSERKNHHPELGFNSRLDTIQAAALNVKLAHLAAWNAARREAARRYGELLARVDGVETPSTHPLNHHVWHLYVVRVPERDRVLRALNDAGIGAGVHYPVPCHLQPAFASNTQPSGSLPVAEHAAREILSLPLYPEITLAQQERVVEALASALQR